MTSSGFLSAFAPVLAVAAATSVLFQKLRLPVVLGFLLAGVLLKFGDQHYGIGMQAHVQSMAEMGVILLMFALGLEFSLKDLSRAGLLGAIVVLFEVGLVFCLGFMLARWFGFSPVLALFVASLLAISSTTLVLRVVDEQKLTGKTKEILLAMLVVEDLVAIVLLALLTTLAKTQSLSAQDLLKTAGALAFFLFLMVAAGLAVVPRLLLKVRATGHAETLLIASIGLAFLGALLAERFGYSVALGAFIAGMLVAEAGVGHEVSELIKPVRDLFAAVFFVAIGLSIDLHAVAASPGLVLAFAACVIVGKGIGVTAGAFAVGAGLRNGVQAGAAAGQIGEFSFVIAALAISIPGGEALGSLAVASATLTACTAPFLSLRAQDFALRLERVLPHPVQNFLSLYNSWIEASRSANAKNESLSRRVRKTVLLIALDLAILSALVIAAALLDQRLLALLHQRTGFDSRVAHALLFGLFLLPMLPVLWGLLRLISSLAEALAFAALPAANAADVDFAQAPRRVFVRSLQFGMSAAAALLLISVTQAFLPPGGALILLIITLGAIAASLWKSTQQLHGHLRAGAGALFELLKTKQSLDMQPVGSQTAHAQDLDDAEQLLPGLGHFRSLTLTSQSKAVNRRLNELNLRAMSGAQVILIRRGNDGFLQPGGHDVLLAGDEIVLSGSLEDLQRAQDLIADPTASDSFTNQNANDSA